MASSLHHAAPAIPLPSASSFRRQAEEIISQMANAKRMTSEPASACTTTRDHLYRISNDFTRILRASLAGRSDDGLRGFDEISGTKQARNLRARVRQISAKFEDVMQTSGQKERLVDDDDDDDTNEPDTVSRSEYISRIQQLMENNNGLPQSLFCNADIVRELFVKQSESWEQIASEAQADVVKAVRTSVSATIQLVAGEAARPIKEYISKEIDDLEHNMKKSLAEIVDMFSNGDYNPRQSIIQKRMRAAQAKNCERMLKNALHTHVDGDIDEHGGLFIGLGAFKLVVADLADSKLANSPSETILDYLIAYYDVSVKTS